MRRCDAVFIESGAYIVTWDLGIVEVMEVMSAYAEPMQSGSAFGWQTIVMYLKAERYLKRSGKSLSSYNFVDRQ